MKTFTIDPTREPEIEYQDTLEFIEFCNRTGYAILGIEVGVFKGDPLDISILDNSHAQGETFKEYMAKCNSAAKNFIMDHRNYINHIFIFALMTEQRYLEYKAQE